MSELVCLMLLAAGVPGDQSPDELAAEKPIELVVTGERIPRTVRETPSSVVVVTESAIEAQGANRVEQLLTLIPNVQVGNGSQGPAIRGMDTTGPLFALPAFLGGNRPRTTLIVDGRPVTYNEFVFGSAPLWDVKRVEVFRSPQTTTQGQNSIAGAIFVHSSDPTFAREYRARAMAGDFRTRQVSTLASGPIAGDDMAFRVAADLRYSRTSSKIDDVMEGADPNHDIYGIVRAKLLLTPSARTRLKLTYVHSQSQAPQTVGVDAPFRRRRDDDAAYGVFRINVDSLTAAVEHELAANLVANAVLTGGNSSARRLAIPGFGQASNNGRDWSAEAVLNWNPDGPFRIVGGVSHRHAALKQHINLSLLSGAIGRFRDWQDGTGIFADATFALSPRITASAGVRYQRDRQTRTGALTADTFDIPVDYLGKFDAWLPKFTIAYDVSPTFRVGALVQKAYNPGGTTVRVDTARPDEFKAETLWDYELFARADLAGGRATASANVFHYGMRNAQRARSISLFTPSGRRVGFANLFNVSRARSYGLETELRWKGSDKLTATIAVGLLGTKAVQADGESAHLAGKEFSRSPHFTGAAAADWRPIDRLRLSAQLRHRGPYFSDPENSSQLRISGGTNVDARAEYRFDQFSLFVQVRNLFDALNLVDLATATSGEAEDPRMVSVGLESRF